MTTDIEQFIAEQKAKLAREKEILQDGSQVNGGETRNRKHWDKSREASAILNQYATRYGKTPVLGYRPERVSPEESGNKFQFTQPNYNTNRQDDNNPYLAEQQMSNRLVTPEDGGRLQIGSDSVDLKRQKLRNDRQNEYNTLINQKDIPPRLAPVQSTNSTEGLLPIGKYGEQRKKHDEERKKEYNEMLKQKGGSSKKTASRPVQRDGLLPIGQNKTNRNQINEDRNREYNEMLAQQTHNEEMRQKENIPPRGMSPDEEVGLIGKLGSYEERRKRLNDERKREYNDLLAQKNVRTRGATEGAENYASALPGMKNVIPSQSPQHSPERRHRSPNPPSPAPRNNTAKPPRPYDDSPRGKLRRRPRHDEDDDFGKSIPGLADHPSAERVDFSDEDDEDEVYGRYLRERPPRRGWATPTYEEILDKKRRDERAYRRYDDPGFMRASRSDGHLNRQVEDDLRKFKDLDREFESKKVRFTETQERSNRVLSDPNWLNSGRGRRANVDDLDDYDYQHDTLTNLRLKYANPSPTKDYPAESNFITKQPAANKYSRIKATPITVVSDLDDQRRDDGRLDRVDYDLTNGPTRGGGPPQQSRRDQNPGGFGATLNIGPPGLFGRDVTASADQRKKAAYRHELERQMQQTRQNKQREKDEDLRVDATGAEGVFTNPNRNKPPPRPTLRDQPSRLLDDNFRLDAYNAPQDDAYDYYGKINPLDANGESSGVSYRDQLHSPAPSKVKFAQDRPQARGPSQGATTPFPSDDDRSRSRADAKSNYKEELLRQIEEDKRKKQKQKEDKERYDRKIEEEIRQYDPFGKGGGGAPMKDSEGNVMADLRIMKNVNDETLLSGRKSKDYKDPTPREDPISSRYSPPPATRPDNPDEPSHHRGGHGIFGDGLTKGQKQTRNKYQEDLAKQIEEKKRQQEIEKQKIKEEEEKLLKKIEEDDRKIKEEFEAEKRKDREKAEEAQRQQEEIKRQQEEKRKEVEKKRMEADEKRQADLRRQEEEKRKDRQNSRSRSARYDYRYMNRGNSPPVPALRSKTEPEHRPAPSRTSSRNRSPPLPATRTQSRQSRAPSADVLNQLARMKAQLQNESKRVEQDIRKQADEPDVYDSRLYQKPITPANRQNVDVFEVARHRDPVPVRRHPHTDDSSNPDHLREFQKLKTGNTASRNDLRSMFPNTPTSSDALETQQRALLEIQQGESSRGRKKGGKNRGPFDQMPGMDPKSMGLFREKSTASANLLDSESAFIGVPENDGFPEDFDDLPRYNKSRNDSARSRRRANRPEDSPYRGIPSSQSNYNPSAMGSQISLDPDSINRRNEDRLKKLKSFGDEVSTGDPDDILERFMAKQQHYSRPPSGHTLQDDSWLRPGTRYDR